MAIIMISRGAYSAGKEVAEKTAEQLGFACISREDLLKWSKDFDLPEIKLIHALEHPPSRLDRLIHSKERYVATIQAGLLNHLKKDNVVYHGFAYHSFVEDLPQVLKVRIISNTEDRIRLVMNRDQVGRKEAIRRMRKIDSQRTKWAQKLYGINPRNPDLYDLVLRIDKMTVQDAAAIICDTAQLEQFQTTSSSKRLLENLALAAEVKTYLIGVRPQVQVCIDDGFISLKTEAPVTDDSQLVGRMEEIMKRISGVRGIHLTTEKQMEDQFVCLREPRKSFTKDKMSTFFTEVG